MALRTLASARSALVVEPTPAPAPALAEMLLLRPRLAVATVPGYSYQGCYSDGATRVLSGAMSNFGRNDAAFCCSWCVNVDTAFTVCAVEDQVQCFCDSTTPATGDAAPDSECSTVCLGNNDACGGYGRMNVYSATAAPSAATAAAPSSSLTAAPVSQFSYLGCFSDTSQQRFLSATSTGNALNDPAYCCAWCLNVDNDYRYCGVEDGGQCFCDTTTLAAGVRAYETDCSMACPGDAGQMCGGIYRLNLYTLTGVVPTSSAPSSSPTSTASSGTAPGPPASSSTGPAVTPSPSHGLHGGAIAGVVVGVLAGLALLAGLAFWLLRRRRRSVAAATEAHEMAGVARAEVAGSSAQFELGQKDAPYGTGPAAAQSGWVHELYAGPQTT